MVEDRTIPNSAIKELAGKLGKMDEIEISGDVREHLKVIDKEIEAYSKFQRLIRDRNYLGAAHYYFDNPQLQEIIDNKGRDKLIKGLYEMVIDANLHPKENLHSI